MDTATRKFVRERAQQRCEYCRLKQSAAPFLTFHIEHITAKQHIVDDSLGNLALACPDCNRHKGPNLTTIDPDTGELMPLFNPRQDDLGGSLQVRRNNDRRVDRHRESHRPTLADE